MIGFLGQGIFASRFLLQWIASEKAKASVIPYSFWWLSLVGSILLLIYAVHIKAWPIILGQLPGFFVYARNLHLLWLNDKNVSRETT
ncbi:MAG: lipid-A-disaccharide synthase N-terminal domain-containing protein [Planctomycetota bacterium]|nr:lipid-A-disaccharide synthase N-terminal domain-containing protein [Planctomycetota bacterium]